MLIAWVLFLFGIALIIKCGDMFVDAAGWTSDVTGISRAVIGATIVSFATTAPEYFVSLIAVLKGYFDLSIGNAVGSLICNLGLAFAALAFFTPGPVHDRHFGFKGAIMVVSAGALWFFCRDGLLSVAEGFCLLACFALSMYVNIRHSKAEDEYREKKVTDRRDIAKNVFKFIGGAAGIIFGSNLIVDNAQIIARALNVSEAVIGLTVVAVGTSLPEIVTSIAAIIKKQNALSVGNIIGANILDATLILATGAFVTNGRLGVSPSTVAVDLPALMVLMALSVLPTVIGGKLFRWQGALLFFSYAAYIIFIVGGNGV